MKQLNCVVIKADPLIALQDPVPLAQLLGVL